jgi:hypothetical protein
MNWKWGEIAEMCEQVYGIYVNWDEEYFICPECDEPIYACDWKEDELDMCPICEFNWSEEE